MLHFIIMPRSQKIFLDGILAIRLKEQLLECADVNGWQLGELDIQPNHVYMTVKLDVNVSPDAMVKTFKRSGKIIQKEFLDKNRFLGKSSFWADGYFSATTMCYNDEMRKEYVAGRL